MGSLQKHFLSCEVLPAGITLFKDKWKEWKFSHTVKKRVND